MKELEHEGVRGGSILFEVPATPEETLDLLLAFDRADGRRAWARSYRTISSGDDGVVAEWSFAGRLGVNPVADLHFAIDRQPHEIVVRYHLVNPVFGLGAFFGDYRIRSVPEDPSHSLLAERVFIDSGIRFISVSREDIAAGLRRDAELIRKWMAEGQVAAQPGR